MRICTAIIERCPDAGLCVGCVPCFAGARSQGETVEEPSGNLKEVIAMIREDGDPALAGEFIGARVSARARSPIDGRVALAICNHATAVAVSRLLPAKRRPSVSRAEYREILQKVIGNLADA